MIVAAGQGVRLRNGVELKPLVHLAGTPLIEHVVRRSRLAGIDEFVVVGGYKGAELRAALDGLSLRNDVEITYVDNPEWQRANGVSLIQTRDYLDGAFVLTMCDHLFDPALLRGLLDAPRRPDSVSLAVDYKITDAVHDPHDVTRVCCTDGRITSIGKHLDVFNCFDTGVFLCDRSMFGALAESQQGGDDSISGAMRVLAPRGAAFGHDIGDKRWIDVDDLAAFASAQSMLDAGLL